MQLDYIVINKHDHKFAVVIVPQPVLGNPTAAEQTCAFFERQYFHIPTVLMARNKRGIPSSYYGPGDLAIQVLNTPLETASWHQVRLG
jgi:hypothetical protein